MSLYIHLPTVQTRPWQGSGDIFASHCRYTSIELSTQTAMRRADPTLVGTSPPRVATWIFVILSVPPHPFYALPNNCHLPGVPTSKTAHACDCRVIVTITTFDNFQNVPAWSLHCPGPYDYFALGCRQN